MTSLSKPPKQYRLTPQVEEDLRHLLQPASSEEPITLQLRFGYPKPATDDPSPLPPPTLPDLHNRPYTVRDLSHEKIYKITFSLNEYSELQRVYHAVEPWPIKEIRINNMVIPYSGNLWLPLLFFYIAEPENPFQQEVSS